LHLYCHMKDLQQHKKKSIQLSFFRNLYLYLQIAFILYPPNVTPWDGKSAENVEFATFFFAWHLASALTFVSVVYFLTCKYIRRA